MRHSLILALGISALLGPIAHAADPTGVVRILTIPGAAEVLVDDTLRGRSPSSMQEHFMIHLAPGDYRIGARKDGFDPVERQVLVTAGTDQTIRLNLAPEIRMISIAGGCFLMGSALDEPERDEDEGPQHQVCVPTFEIGQREVTFADWDACVNDQACDKNPSDGGWGRGEHPVMNVSWNDIQDYLRWLNRLTGQGYRLPSEAEWEYAARAGTSTPFSTGTCIDTSQANHDGTFAYDKCPASSGGGLGRTVAVGSYPPNPWNLLDMHGNVSELTADCWNEDYTGAPTDGSAWLTGNCAYRVMRGGSWNGYASDLRSAFRCRVGPSFSHRGIGFRLARTPTQ
ncbi:MAG: PEGA domain-containing protein [Sphingobacteriia bacterium]|nr:PEGA domain-containing protein [Sphingobacteriia bacterium]NCC37839.1 PEGA domain-containing protein [Gammaproteobacteria bacterium]